LKTIFFKELRMKVSKYYPALLLLGIALVQSVSASSKITPVVDTAWLNAHKDQVKVLQVMKSVGAFTKAPVVKTEKGKSVVKTVAGHVPGATLVDFNTIRVKRKVQGKAVKKLIPLKADFEKLAQSWGVNKDDTIVLVPMGLNTGDVNEAARLYWQFKYYGHQNLAILDGGMAEWLAAGLPAATKAAPVKAGNWVARAEDKSVLATYDDVKKALSGKQVQLADARPQNQYMGVFTKKGELSGHLKGAKDMSPDLITRADGASARFLPVASYKSMMQAKGLNPDAETIAYCNTGHQAAGVWFVAHELIGNKKTKLYDGSLVEYSLLGGETTNPAKL
jgi:thiosulfate/3-mercaptopyruvate sulfurtransferase